MAALSDSDVIPSILIMGAFERTTLFLAIQEKISLQLRFFICYFFCPVLEYVHQLGNSILQRLEISGTSPAKH